MVSINRLISDKLLLSFVTLTTQNYLTQVVDYSFQLKSPQSCREVNQSRNSKNADSFTFLSCLQRLVSWTQICVGLNRRKKKKAEPSQLISPMVTANLWL